MDANLTKKPAAVFLFALMQYVSLFSGPYLEPRIFSPGDRPGNVEALIEYSCLASGLEGRELDACRLLFSEFVESVPSESILSGEHPGEELLLYIHSRLFRGYSEPQTLIDVVFDTGVYNCVSSAVIYTVAALSLGLDVEGVLTPDHVFCAVTENGVPVDVETTTPFGFNPGEQRDFVNAFGQTGYTYVPPGHYHLRESINSFRLISLILQNRISLLERKGEYEKAVELSVERYSLSPDEKAYTDLHTEFRNYASGLNKKGRYEEALAFLDAARARYGDIDGYAVILATLVYNLAVSRSEEGRGRDALEIIDARFDSGDISREDWLESRYVIGDALGYRIVNGTDDAAGASAEIDGLYGEGLLEHDRYIEYKIALVSKEAKALAGSGDNIRALVLVRKAAESLGPHQYLLQAMRIFEHNAVVEIHNKAVEYMNRNNPDAALKVIEDGLEALPGNSVLLDDRQKIISSIR